MQTLPQKVSAGFTGRLRRACKCYLNRCLLGFYKSNPPVASFRNRVESPFFGSSASPRFT